MKASYLPSQGQKKNQSDTKTCKPKSHKVLNTASNTLEQPTCSTQENTFVPPLFNITLYFFVSDCTTGSQSRARTPFVLVLNAQQTTGPSLCDTGQRTNGDADKERWSVTRTLASVSQNRCHTSATSRRFYPAHPPLQPGGFSASHCSEHPGTAAPFSIGFGRTHQ